MYSSVHPDSFVSPLVISNECSTGTKVAAVVVAADLLVRSYPSLFFLLATSLLSFSRNLSGVKSINLKAPSSFLHQANRRSESFLDVFWLSSILIYWSLSWARATVLALLPEKRLSLIADSVCLAQFVASVLRSNVSEMRCPRILICTRQVIFPLLLSRF